MKVLVIGSGGREHALVWKIAKSKKVDKIFCAPGNPGTSTLAENISIQPNELLKLVQFAKEENISLTIVGPEIPLIEGIVDLFTKNNIKIIGPSKKAAQIEGSKVFAKKLLLKYKIPTASFAVFDDYRYARKFLESQKYPLVIKADGQCAGKGVSVCKDEKDAQKFLKSLMRDKIFGNSGNKVIIEECLSGQEVSFMLATDGNDFVSMITSQDHKRALDGDNGSNTGGMGAYAPVPILDKKTIRRIENEIVKPVISAMQKENAEYKGILYPGLIMTKEGPKVLEFNCRFGDPETQPLMCMMKSDIIELFEAILLKKLKNFKIQWHKGSAVCVVLTAKGYPGKYEKGQKISLAAAALSNKGINVFQAGTEKKDEKLVSHGGRVLGVTARGTDLKEAIEKVYKHIGRNCIHFSGMHFRKDIGKKGLNKKLWV